jgi:GcrA cell cycle regulator
MQIRPPSAAPKSDNAPSPWTPEAEVRALRLYLVEGLSASQVAAALGGGLSRAAVASKVRRLGYHKREVAVRLDATRVAPAAGVRSRIQRHLPPTPPPQPLPPLREAPATGQPSTLAALTVNACRWPINDPGPGEMHAALFCAGVAEVGAYCAVHRALARRSSAPKVAP